MLKKIKYHKNENKPPVFEKKMYCYSYDKLAGLKVNLRWHPSLKCARVSSG